MEIMPEKLCVDPYAKKGTHSWTQFFQFTGLEALMERKHMFKLGADEGCYGIAGGEEDESEVEYDSDASDTPRSKASCRCFSFNLGITNEKGRQLCRCAS